jgi:hypothetical protein
MWRFLKMLAAAWWALLKVSRHIPGAWRVIRKRDQLIASRKARKEANRLDRIRHPEKYRGE